MHLFDIKTAYCLHHFNVIINLFRVSIRSPRDSTYDKIERKKSNFSSK